MWLEIVLFLVLLLVYAVIRDRRPRNCPPGPPEIPFFGNLPIVAEEPAEKLKEKYGDIVMHRTGHLRTIIIFDYKVAKEAMTRLEFSDRPPFFMDFSIDEQKLGGVVGSNGPHWQHDRRFVLRNLRNLGMGRSYLEEAINIEAKALVEDLKKYNGEAINYPDSFRTAALNIIWQMVASTRYDLRSKEVDAVYDISKKFQDDFSPIMFLPSFVPALNHLPKVIKDTVFGDYIIDELNAEMLVTVNKAIDKHLEDYDPDNPRDLIDEYIKDMKESEGDENSFFRRGALAQIVSDMFQAGSDTVNHMLKWVAYFLARYPDYAKRMQKQIDEVVPKDRMVSLDDKERTMWLEILLFLVLLLVYAVIRDRRPRNCPPGRAEIPFLGNFPVIEGKAVQVLKEQYGDIVMHRTGNFRGVFLFDYKVAKEAMARPEFADRPSFFANFSVDDQKLGGVVASNGPHWQHDRRFVLRNLRNLGMGRSYLEEAINIEAEALVEDLKKYNGEAINYPDSFRTASLNIIWQMVASTRYDLRSTEVDVIYKLGKEFQDKFTAAMFLPSVIPALNYLPKTVKDFLFHEDIVRMFFEEMKAVIGTTIDKHLEDYDPDNPRDLIDEYIKDMKESEGDENSFFRRGALNQIVNDLFTAGSDTVNQMLKWEVYLLARYPDYAKRMQKEIDAVVPKDRMVSLQDRAKLPLVEAFTTESLRYSSLVPINIQRSATRDTTIEGYFIPKDTIIAVGNYSIHHDPRYWDDPHKFYPERFLDETRTKYTAPKQGFFAFGSGRRQCAGELLARMELFLFTAAIIQNFDVLPGDGVDLSELETITVSVFRVPVDKKLVYAPRA